MSKRLTCQRGMDRPARALTRDGTVASAAMRRLVLALLWLSAAAILLAFWLGQREREDNANSEAISQFIDNSSQPNNADYTVPFLVGAGGIVGVVVSVSVLKRLGSNDQPSP